MRSATCREGWLCSATQAMTGTRSSMGVGRGECGAGELSGVAASPVRGAEPIVEVPAAAGVSLYTTDTDHLFRVDQAHGPVAQPVGGPPLRGSADPAVGLLDVEVAAGWVVPPSGGVVEDWEQRRQVRGRDRIQLQPGGGDAARFGHGVKVAPVISGAEPGGVVLWTRRGHHLARSRVIDPGRRVRFLVQQRPLIGNTRPDSCAVEHLR